MTYGTTAQFIFQGPRLPTKIDFYPPTLKPPQTFLVGRHVRETLEKGKCLTPGMTRAMTTFLSFGSLVAGGIITYNVSDLKYQIIATVACVGLQVIALTFCVRSRYADDSVEKEYRVFKICSCALIVIAIATTIYGCTNNIIHSHSPPSPTPDSPIPSPQPSPEDHFPTP